MEPIQKYVYYKMRKIDIFIFHDFYSKFHELFDKDENKKYNEFIKYLVLKHDEYEKLTYKFHAFKFMYDLMQKYFKYQGKFRKSKLVEDFDDLKKFYKERKHEYNQKEQKKIDDELFKNINKNTEIKYEEDLNKSLFIPRTPKEIKPSIKYVETKEYKQKEQKKIDNELFKNIKNKTETIINDDIKIIKSKDERKNDFKKFVENQNIDINSQKDIVDKCIEKMMNNPTDWFIYFDDFNNTSKKYLFPKLLEFFHDYIDNLPITE